MATTRRQFLRNTGCGMLSAAAVVKGLDTLFLTNALAQPADVDDYKALVCVFLFGGNDANNIVIPYTNYAAYADVRDAGGTVQLAIPQGLLLQVSPPSDGNVYGLHPALGTGPINDGLFSLWNQGVAAAVVNVGTMIDPSATKDQLRQGINRPYQLFSHSDQQSAWQTSTSTGPSPTGWGGRVADRIRGAQRFPVVTSISGVQIFTLGAVNRPLVANQAPTRLDQLLAINRDFYGTDASPGPARQIVGLDLGAGSPLIVQAAASITSDVLSTRDDLVSQGDPTLVTTFPNTGIGNQLKQVAKLIKVAPFIGLPDRPTQRQIFFVAIGGFDTHNNQGRETGQQATLWQQVSQAITAFYQATVELGVSNKVTTFTVSDFSRTFKPANPGSGVGTDHAWGSHQFVVGGAVNGGDFYGQYPDVGAMGGPQDYDVGSGSRGRWIPTTSVDQMAFTMANWYGVRSDDMGYVFPNIGRFSTPNLGFMQAPAGAATVKANTNTGLVSNPKRL